MRHVEKMLDRMPSSKRAVRFAIAALVLVVFLLIGILFWQVHQNSQVAASNAAVARSRGQALGTANAKLTQHGIPAVKPSNEQATPGATEVGPTTPSSTPKAGKGLQGETGASGAAGPGPTTAQVEDAVADYCAKDSRCKGGPTQAQVAAAVLTYCTTKDDCSGPTGASGKAGASGSPGASGTAGKDGSNGQAGAAGPGPTADQISAAVTAYCADGACVGAKGDTGAQGAAGADGKDGAAGPAGKDGSNGADGKNGADAPHFTKIECSADNTWAFTLSDGTVLHADGPCRAATVTVTAPPTDPPTSPDPTSTAP